MKFTSGNVEIWNLANCTRPIFDSACAEYLGAEESARALSCMMKEFDKSFETILIEYFSIITTQKMYWLEGLFHSLYNLCFFSESVRDYIKSYKWENIFLYKPFNQKGYPFYYWQNLLERMFHKLVDHAREIESKNA